MVARRSITKTVFIDFNFYLGINGQPIVKEFAYASLDGKFGGHHIFNAPYPKNQLYLKDQHTVTWCEYNLNTIPWSDGVEQYSNLNPTLQKLLNGVLDNFNIFVKGREKAKALRYMLQNLTPNPPYIVEMEDSLQTPSLKNLKLEYPTVYTFSKCYFHSDGCVLGNVHLLIRWYWEYLLTNDF